jgi:hypothetical protein
MEQQCQTAVLESSSAWWLRDGTVSLGESWVRTGKVWTRPAGATGTQKWEEKQTQQICPPCSSPYSQTRSHRHRDTARKLPGHIQAVDFLESQIGDPPLQHPAWASQTVSIHLGSWFRMTGHNPAAAWTTTVKGLSSRQNGVSCLPHSSPPFLGFTVEV